MRTTRRGAKSVSTRRATRKANRRTRCTAWRRARSTTLTGCSRRRAAPLSGARPRRQRVALGHAVLLRLHGRRGAGRRPRDHRPLAPRCGQLALEPGGRSRTCRRLGHLLLLRRRLVGHLPLRQPLSPRQRRGLRKLARSGSGPQRPRLAQHDDGRPRVHDPRRTPEPTQPAPAGHIAHKHPISGWHLLPRHPSRNDSKSCFSTPSAREAPASRS